MPSNDPADPSHQHTPEAVRSDAVHIDIAGRQIEPGDYLPPQAELLGTQHHHDGFTVGDEDRDVLPGLAVRPGRMLLSGPAGTLDSVAHDAQVAVRRVATTAQEGGAPA